MSRTTRRRGYTTAEVLIASFLSAILSAIVAVTLVSTSRSTSETVENTRLQQEHRVLVDVLGQFLRSAKPLGVCLSNDDPCSTVAEGDHPFIEVTPSSLKFFSYTNAASAESVAASGTKSGFAPDLVKVSVDPVVEGCDQSRYACFPLTIALSCNSSADMNAREQSTCPEQSSANRSMGYADRNVRTILEQGLNNAQLVRTIYVNNPAPFAFFDENNVDLTASCATSCTDSNTDSSKVLARIATIRIDNNDPDCDPLVDSPLCRKAVRISPIDPVVFALPSRGFRD